MRQNAKKQPYALPANTLTEQIAFLHLNHPLSHPPLAPRGNIGMGTRALLPPPLPIPILLAHPDNTGICRPEEELDIAAHLILPAHLVPAHLRMRWPDTACSIPTAPNAPSIPMPQIRQIIPILSASSAPAPRVIPPALPDNTGAGLRALLPPPQLTLHALRGNTGMCRPEEELDIALPLPAQPQLIAPLNTARAGTLWIQPAAIAITPQ